MLPDAKNYNFVYMSTMLKGCTLDEIYNLFHSSNAPDIKGHALGVSDINTKRNYVGFEIDEAYYNIAVERISKLKNISN